MQGIFWAETCESIFWAGFWCNIVGIPVFALLVYIGSRVELYWAKQRGVPGSDKPDKEYPDDRYFTFSLLSLIWLGTVCFDLTYFICPIYAEALPYRQDSIEKKDWKRAVVETSLAVPGTKYSPGALSVTCAAAAKYYVERYGYATVRIIISEYPKSSSSYEDLQEIARCSYSPEGYGWLNGDGDVWVWKDFEVGPSLLSERQREVNRLWAKWSDDFRDERGFLDWRELRKAIGKHLAIPYDETDSKNFVLRPLVLYFLLSGIEPEAPVNAKLEDAQILESE